MFLENKNINAPDIPTLREVTELKVDNKESMSRDLTDMGRRMGLSSNEGLKKIGDVVDDLFSEEEDEKVEIKEENYKENKLAKLDENYQLTPDERKMMEGWSDAEVNKFVADANYYKEHGRKDFEDYKQHLIREKNGLENRQVGTGNVDTGNQNQNLESDNDNYQQSGDSGMGGGAAVVEGGGGGSSGGGYENNDVKVTDQGGDKVVTNNQGQERGRAIPLEDGSYNVVDNKTGKATNVSRDEKTGEYVATDTDNGNEVGRMTEAEAKEKYGQW